MSGWLHPSERPSWFKRTWKPVCRHSRTRTMVHDDGSATTFCVDCGQKLAFRCVDPETSWIRDQQQEGEKR